MDFHEGHGTVREWQGSGMTCELALRVTGYRYVTPLAQPDVICWTHSPSSEDTIRNHENLPETEENKKSGKTQSCITNRKKINPYQITYNAMCIWYVYMFSVLYLRTFQKVIIQIQNLQNYALKSNRKNQRLHRRVKNQSFRHVYCLNDDGQRNYSITCRKKL
jgi:hypothetical protein